MDKIFRSCHLEPLPRRFPHRFPVQRIGYVPHKRDRIAHPFRTLNFSFILGGSGTYRIDGRTWPVEAPCVITQWPEVHVEYGPDGEWEELYIIYAPALQGAMEAARLVARGKPVWYIRDSGPTQACLESLREELQAPEASGTADRIDRLCESMIMESLLSEERREVDPALDAAERIRAHVEARWREDHDFDALALFEGLSPSTFRRTWARISRTPPARYVTRLRLRHACRMLAESNAPVGSVARECGFGDPLYFSRKFREFTGESPSAYRHHRHDPLSFAEGD